MSNSISRCFSSFSNSENILGVDFLPFQLCLSQLRLNWNIKWASIYQYVSINGTAFHQLSWYFGGVSTSLKDFLVSSCYLSIDSLLSVWMLNYKVLTSRYINSMQTWCVLFVVQCNCFLTTTFTTLLSSLWNNCHYIVIRLSPFKLLVQTAE